MPDADAHSTEVARMLDDMRAWRAREVPASPLPQMSAERAELLGVTTPDGAQRYARLVAYRDAGYTGPLDRDARIPDPAATRTRESVSALARLGQARLGQARVDAARTAQLAEARQRGTR